MCDVDFPEAKICCIEYYTEAILKRLLLFKNAVSKYLLNITPRKVLVLWSTSELLLLELFGVYERNSTRVYA